MNSYTESGQGEENIIEFSLKKMLKQIGLDVDNKDRFEGIKNIIGDSK